MTTSRAPAIAAASGAGVASFLALVHLVVDASTSSLNALLPSLQQQFNLDEVALASLVTSLGLGTSVLQPFFGALADRWGRRLPAALGLIVVATLLSLLPYARTFAVLVGLLLAGGLGSAAFHPAAAGLTRFIANDRRASAMGLFSAGGAIGIALGPLAVLALNATLGSDVLPLVAIPAVALAIAVPFVLRDHNEAPRGPRVRFVDIRLLRDRVGSIAVVAAVLNTAQVTFLSGIPLWLVRYHGIAPEAPLIGAALGVFSLSGALGGLALGLAERHFQQTHLVSGSMLIAPMFLLATLQATPSSWPFWVFTAVAGFVLGAVFPLLVVSAQEHAPGAESAASGIVFGAAAGIAGVLYLGVGFLQQWLGLEAAFAITWLNLIPGAVLGWLAMRSRRAASDLVLPPSEHLDASATPRCVCAAA